jgi:HAD superfamily hydrolase (TIGR01509 family)
MARVRAVLFDIDGTLLDSNDAHAHAWLDALRGHGIDVSYDLVRSKIGLPGDTLLAEVAGVDPTSPEGKLISERRVAVFKALYLPDLGPLPGARSIVERLRMRRLMRAVVSSASAAEMPDLLRAAAIANLFDLEVSADDAAEGKPEPDLVQVALDKLEVGPREAVMIGDTPFDIVAAARAGVSTIALRSGGWKDAELVGAIAIYDHPQDLISHIEASPIALGLDDATPRVSPSRHGRTRRPSAGSRL